MKVKVKTLVAQFVNSKEGSQHEMARLYNMAVRGAKKFQMEVTGRVKTVLLEKGANGTIALPPDYVSYSKVGVVDAFGKIYTFKHNATLSAMRGETATGSTYSGVARNSIYANFYLHGMNHNLLGYALGRATIGEFHIDEEDGVIRIDFHNQFHQIMLEYLPDGYDDTAKDYCIDERATEAFIAWLRWQDSIDKRKTFSKSDVRYFMKEFYRERRNLRWVMNPVIISEMEDIRRDSIKLCAKA